MKKSGEYKAIIFDLDGTLIDSMPYHVKAFIELFRRREIKIKFLEFDNLAGRPTKEILEILLKKYKLKENIPKLREERRKIYFNLVDGKKIYFPGVIKTIIKLKKKYKVAIATGSSKSSFSHSVNKKFDDLFDTEVFVDDVKRGKPSPDELLFVAKRLGIKPSECLMVGDTIFDQIAAKKAKMDSIGVLTGKSKRKDLLKAGAKYVLESVNELDKVI